MSIIPKYKACIRLATTANLLTMALVMPLFSCDKGDGNNSDNDDNNSGNKVEKLKFTLAAPKVTGVDATTKMAEIVIEVTVTKGEFDPNQWTITTNNYSAKDALAKNSLAELTCSEEGNPIKVADPTFPDKLTKGDGMKSFKIHLCTNRSSFKPSSPKNNVKIGQATLVLTGKHKNKDTFEAYKAVATQLNFETNLN